MSSDSPQQPPPPPYPGDAKSGALPLPVGTAAILPNKSKDAVFTEASLVAEATNVLMEKKIFPEIDEALRRASAAGRFSASWTVDERIRHESAEAAMYLMNLIYRRYEGGHPYRFVVKANIASHYCPNTHRHPTAKCREQLPQSVEFHFPIPSQT